MKITLKLEELAMTAIAIYFLSIHNLGISFWWWSLIFFSPDISMLGYLLNTRVGAISYNLFHHKGIALVTVALGYYFHNDIVIAIGILLFAHSSFDRTMGYGLKYPDSFKNAHLGTL
jgi:positive regulator of sigma E activity